MLKLLRTLSLLLTGLFLFVFFFIVGASLTQTMPKVLLVATGIDQWEYQPREQSVIYYSNGQEMTRLGYKRIYSDSFPDFMKDLVVAVEDRRFYEHNGLDARGIGRAVWNNLRAGNKVEGGSTITQQLARTLFLSQEKTYTRKIKEVFVAVAIEEKYSKAAILNMYLNEIYMGRGCSGIPSAARSYFGKDVGQLNKAEISMLVGIIQAPEAYAPERNFAGLKARQDTVLNIAVEQGLLNPDEAVLVREQPLNIKDFTPESSKHPYLTSYISSKAEELLGTKSLYQAGLKIYTTVDSRMQDAAEIVVKKHARSLAARGINAGDIALVSIDPATGGVKSMVGGVNFQENQLNMAILPRQPGSAIKPLYYAAAMDEGIINSNTILNNKPRSFGQYQPQNYGKAPEKTSVRNALVYSYNVASVEVLNQLGVNEAFSYLQRWGITTLQEEDKHLALALGGMTKGISPIQMAAAYAAFPEGGIYRGYFCINYIEDTRGRVIYSNRSNSWRVISRNTAESIDTILKAVVSYGTGSQAAIAISSAGKTGTTTDSRDLWYIGYTRELSTAVWAGNSNGNVVQGYSSHGGSVSAPIWREYMNSLFYSGVFKEKPVRNEPVVELPAESEEELEDDLEEPYDEEDNEIEEPSNQEENEVGEPTVEEEETIEELPAPGEDELNNQVIPGTEDILEEQNSELPSLPQ
ncbi:MAG: transglycosylase domain-containing protein [Syntrophomonadaceae bacterium]|jgi:penicillin-binding protein 1A